MRDVRSVRTTLSCALCAGPAGPCATRQPLGNLRPQGAALGGGFRALAGSLGGGASVNDGQSSALSGEDGDGGADDESVRARCEHREFFDASPRARAPTSCPRDAPRGTPPVQNASASAGASRGGRFPSRQRPVPAPSDDPDSDSGSDSEGGIRGADDGAGSQGLDGDAKAAAEADAAAAELGEADSEERGSAPDDDAPAARSCGAAMDMREGEGEEEEEDVVLPGQLAAADDDPRGATGRVPVPGSESALNLIFRLVREASAVSVCVHRQALRARQIRLCNQIAPLVHAVEFQPTNLSLTSVSE